MKEKYHVFKVFKDPFLFVIIMWLVKSIEYFYNLSIGIDEDTKLVSLMESVKPELMFNDVYAHRASMSETMRNSFKAVAESLIKQFRPKNVLEIGSNDGVDTSVSYVASGGIGNVGDFTAGITSKITVADDNITGEYKQEETMLSNEINLLLRDFK